MRNATHKRNHIVTALAAIFLAGAPSAGCSGDDGATGTDGTGGTAGTGGSSTSTSGTGTTTSGSSTGTTGTGSTTTATGTDTGTGDTGTGDTGTTGTGDTGTGAGTTGGTTGGVGIEIAGMYTDEFGTQHEISDTLWLQDFGGGAMASFHIMEFDNAGDWAVAQNDAGNAFNPDAFSRFDWTEYQGSLWYCQTVFDAQTLQDAKDAAPADATDPSTGGCGTFPWTNLTP